jgi:hypothetical protein
MEDAYNSLKFIECALLPEWNVYFDTGRLQHRTLRRIWDGVQRQVTRRTQVGVYCITHRAANNTFMLMLRIVYFFYLNLFPATNFFHISILYYWSRNGCKRHIQTRPCRNIYLNEQTCLQVTSRIVFGRFSVRTSSGTQAILFSRFSSKKMPEHYLH